MGKASWPEYFGALKQMEALPDLPQGWLPALSSHLEELVNMAELWEWPTCRRWSEKVFQ